MGSHASTNIQNGAKLLNDIKTEDDLFKQTLPSEMSTISNNDIDYNSVSEHIDIAKHLGEPIIEIRDIYKQFTIKGLSGYEVIHALSGVTLARDSEFGPIKRGEFVMIRGPPNGGKTTLLRMLGSLDYPTSGTVEILSSKEKIGFVSQTLNLISTLSAFENVKLPIIHGTLSKKECKNRAILLLKLVGLGDRLEHLPSELSGGEKQIVAIARALVNEPEILLLDEPVGHLNTRSAIEIMDIILSINQNEKTTCIMVTHNGDLEVYADRILYVKDGKFQKQAINKQQTKLEFKSYVTMLNTMRWREEILCIVLVMFLSVCVFVIIFIIK